MGLDAVADLILSRLLAVGGQAIAVVCDAAQEDDVRRMVAAGVKAFGKIDTLVNNAGDGGPTKKVEEYTMEDWRYTIDSCLTSSYLCIRFVVPEMRKAGGGAIVNISSGAGRRGLPYRIGYCSSKAGQVGMTFGMALELAPEIRVNCVAPGAVEGDRIDRVIAGQAEVRGISVEQMRKDLDQSFESWRQGQRHCWRRWGDADRLYSFGAGHGRLSGSHAAGTPTRKSSGGGLSGIGSSGRSAGGATVTSGPREATSRSGTNNQVASVDEADFVMFGTATVSAAQAARSRRPGDSGCSLLLLIRERSPLSPKAGFTGLFC